MTYLRAIYSDLEDWKVNPRRKPLILRGARQVGKTTLVDDFSKVYTNRIFLNLERPADLQYFKDFQDVSTLVEALFARQSIPSDLMGSTLLFIDEIQESPEAIALLRYFYEDLPALHVIAAGSLLEHVMQKVKNFPVGRVQYLYIFPLNFLEYLVAKNHSGALEEIDKIPIKDYAHSLLKDLFHEYTIIGGMPEVVSTYLEKENLSDLAPIYEGIWSTYKEDVEKYALNATDARVIKHVISTAHLYLEERIKFQNFGNSNYRSREVGEAIRNLNDARIIQLIYPTTETEIPLRPDLKKAPRLQFLDTGLVNHELKIQVDMLAMEDFNAAYKGAIIPHIITQEIMSLSKLSYYKPNFWVREKRQSSAEVDLVLQHKNKVIPIEIKSGKVGKLRSLHQFVEKSEHPYAIRMYAGKFSVEQHHTPMKKKAYLLMNLPYYLGTKIFDYIAYFVDNYTLDETQ